MENLDALYRKLVDEIDLSFEFDHKAPAANTVIEIIRQTAEAESRNIVADAAEALKLLDDKLCSYCLWMFKPERSEWRERFLDVLELGIELYLRTGHQRRMEFIETFSRGQKRLRQLVREIFPQEEVIDEHEFHGLRFDVYLPALATAFEYDGEQHFRFVPVFHKSESDFRHQQELDRYKADLCQQEKINLIRIRHDEDLSLATVMKKALGQNLIMQRTEP
jgi:hypothetical protein